MGSRIHPDDIKYEKQLPPSTPAAIDIDQENGGDRAESESNGNGIGSGGLAKDRNCTDLVFLILLAAFVIVLVCLLAYCMTQSDIYRIINGFDDCGNVCGRENVRIEYLGCSGVNHTNQKFLLVNAESRESNSRLVYRSCIETCENLSGYQRFLTRCVPITYENAEQTTPVKSFFSKTGINNFFQEVGEDLQLCWKEILYMCIFALVFSVIILFALRYIAGAIVWTVLIGIVIALIVGTIFLWILYAQKLNESSESFSAGENKNSTRLACAIVLTLATICICLVISAMRKRIGMVIALFKEAGKALTNMPLLLFEPILTFLALSFFVAMWLYFALNVESAGEIELRENMSVKFAKNSTILVTRWYNWFALFWFVNFVIGCQHMIIAGAVASWFFTRNKARLSDPISNSFNNLVRYHLGTIALGSLLIALMNMIRAMMKAISSIVDGFQNKMPGCFSTICSCFLYGFETFLKFITRNAYIETALSGEPFCRAGRRAFHILASNSLRVFAINSLGDFVLLLAKAFIVLCTVLIGIELIQKKEGVLHSWVPLLLAGLFAYLVAHCFISIYEITIDTIFICFCEDCEQNDGIARPYFMSRGLMDFVQNSKKVLQINDDRSGKAWSVEKTPSAGSRPK